MVCSVIITQLLFQVVAWHGMFSNYSTIIIPSGGVAWYVQ